MVELNELQAKLKKTDGFRVKHTQSVKETAVKMAKHHNVDLDKVKIASLLHDYARHFNNEKLKKIVKENNIDVDKIEQKVPALLHSAVGAYLAGKEFNIKDQDILNAIRYHTIGRPGMSILEKIIFVADVVEPGRDFPGVDLIREKIYKNIDEAVILVCDFTIKYNIDRRRIIHPNTLFTRNSLLKGDN